jgi:hypothetical protein
MNLKEFENWRVAQGYIYLNNSPRQYGDRFYEDQDGNWVNGWTLFKKYKESLTSTN